MRNVTCYVMLCYVMLSHVKSHDLTMAKIG